MLLSCEPISELSDTARIATAISTSSSVKPESFAAERLIGAATLKAPPFGLVAELVLALIDQLRQLEIDEPGLDRDLAGQRLDQDRVLDVVLADQPVAELGLALELDRRELGLPAREEVQIGLARGDRLRVGVGLHAEDLDAVGELDGLAEITEGLIGLERLEQRRAAARDVLLGDRVGIAGVAGPEH